MYKTDEIDAKILRDLLKDANKSFADIAKETNLTKEAIAKRFQQMKQAGVILGATIQMDYKSFGYNAVADLLVKVDPQQIEQITEYIRKIPNIYSAYQLDDLRYNLKIVATLKDLKELDQVKDAIKRQKTVTNLTTNIWTDIKNIPENLAIAQPYENKGKIKEEIAQTKISSQKSEIDEIDIKIVEKLGKNSRESFRKIGQEVGTSTDTVARRYKKLNENRTIRAVLQIDPTKIGYNAYACFKIAFMSQNNSTNIVEDFLKIPDLTLIIKTSGDFDMSVFIIVKDLKQLLTVQKEIARIPGITRLETKITDIHSPWPSPRQYISTF